MSKSNQKSDRLRPMAYMLLSATWASRFITVFLSVPFVALLLTEVFPEHYVFHFGISFGIVALAVVLRDYLMHYLFKVDERFLKVISAFGISCFTATLSGLNICGFYHLMHPDVWSYHFEIGIGLVIAEFLGTLSNVIYVKQQTHAVKFGDGNGAGL